MNRREFLQICGASLAALGFGCKSSADSVAPIAEPQAVGVNPWVPPGWDGYLESISAQSRVPILESREPIRPGTHTYTFDMHNVCVPTPTWGKPRSHQPFAAAPILRSTAEQEPDECGG